MTGNRCDGRRVLCVVTRANGRPDALSASLRAAGVEVEVCGDVYRGLARLGRGRGEAFDAVVLSLDWLAFDDYGFITEASRGVGGAGEGGVGVYVYSGGQMRDRIERALSLGARGAIEAEADSIERMFREVAVRITERREQDGDRERVEGEDDGGPVGARVPWRDAGDRVRRRPPPGMGESAEDSTLKGADFEDGPLLSGAEIEQYLICPRG